MTHGQAAATAMKTSIETRLEPDGSLHSFVRGQGNAGRRSESSYLDDLADEEAFFPTKLALCGLGTCTVMTLRLFAASAGLDLGTIRVVVTTFNDQERQRICRRVSFQRNVFKRDRLRLAAVCEKTPWTTLLKSRMPLLTEIL